MVRGGPVNFEAALVAAKADEAWGYEALWSSFAPRVAAYLRLRGERDPDDLTSEVFLAAFRRLKSFEGGEAGFRAWVFLIARCRQVDQLRRASVRPLPARGQPGPAAETWGGDTEDDALCRLGRDRVERLCDQLPKAQRDVLLLRVVADLTVEQVAELMGRTPGAVKALQRRGLTQLRCILENEAYPFRAAVRSRR